MLFSFKSYLSCIMKNITPNIRTSAFQKLGYDTCVKLHQKMVFGLVSTELLKVFCCQRSRKLHPLEIILKIVMKQLLIYGRRGCKDLWMTSFHCSTSIFFSKVACKKIMFLETLLQTTNRVCISFIRLNQRRLFQCSCVTKCEQVSWLSRVELRFWIPAHGSASDRIYKSS